MNLNLFSVRLKGLNLDAILIKIYNQNIHLKNVKRISHEEISFVISKSDFKKVEKYIKLFDYSIEDIGIKRYKKYLLSHISILFALPIIIYCCYFASLFVWEIKINGLNSTTESSVLTLLKDNKVAKWKLRLYTESEIEKILIDSGKFAQVSCYYRGTTLMINVSEKLVYEIVEYQPITAKYSGIITDYKLEQGTINFVLGEYVNSGDVLVLPYMIDKDGNKVLVEPKARIEAKVFVTATVTKPKNEIILVPSGKTYTRYTISYKTTKKSFTKLNNPFVFYETKVYNKYISDVVPFVRQKVVFIELIQQVKVNNLNAIKLDIEEESRVIAKSLINNTTVLNETTSSVIANDILYATTTLTFMGSII